MAILWFNKARKIEDFKTNDLRKERIAQEVQQDQLVTRMRRAQDEHDGTLAAAAEPGLSDADLDIAAYKMEQASKRKAKAEAGLQQVLTRLQQIDSIMDILDQKKELQKQGIWKKINDLDQDKLSEQLETIAIERKENGLNANKISEMLETDLTDVRAKHSAAFRKSREAIEALRSQQSGS